MPGSSLVVAPTDTDLAAPEMAAGLEESFGGGGYTAKQRAALLQLASDHVSSALDGRESAFENHASGGMPGWRYAGNRLLTLAENLLLGSKLSEFHTGYRAFSRTLLEKLPIERNSNDFAPRTSASRTDPGGARR